MKINLKVLGFIILFLSLIEPDYFTSITVIHYYYLIIRGISLFLAVMFFLIKRQFPKVTSIIIIYFFIYGISTYMNNGYFYGFLAYALSLISLIAWIEIVLLNYTAKGLYSLNFVFSTFVYANIIFFLLFPNGYTQIVSGTGTIVNRYFLGVYNQFAAILIPAIIINVLYTTTKYGRLKLHSYILMCSVLFTFIYFWSATSILGITLIIIFLIITKRNSLKVFINNKTMLLGMTFLYMVIVVLDKIEVFSFVIEEILKKDITLSTRTIIWEAAIDMIKYSPYMGFGYLGSGRYIVFSLVRSRDAHNTVLQLLLQHGFIGMVPLIVLLIMFIKNTNKYKNTFITKFLIASLFASFVMMISEVYAFRFLLVVLILGIFSYKINELNEKNRLSEVNYN